MAIETGGMEKIKRLLKCNTIAVVGFSKDPTKDAHRIPMFLKEKGYEVIPINPTANEILGMQCYQSISQLPKEIAAKVEVIDIFRPPQDVPKIVDDAINLKKQYDHLIGIWMQLGIESPEAAMKAESEGLIVVQNKCMKIECQKMLAHEF